MMKRSYPFDDDLNHERQFKMHRSCRAEANLLHCNCDPVITHNTSYLFGEYRHISNSDCSRGLTKSRSNDATVIMRPTAKHLKQMHLNSRGQLCEINEHRDIRDNRCFATTTLSSNCSSCYRQELTMQERCNFCEKVVCNNCIRRCTRCDGKFCTLCSLPSYCGKHEAAICLSCS